MKKLEIIIRPEKLEELKEIFNKYDVHGMNLVNIMGYGNQKGNLKSKHKYVVNLLPKIKVESVVTNEQAPKIVDRVVEEIQTGNFGDGKIFIFDVEDAVRIRTGVHGEDAL